MVLLYIVLALAVLVLGIAGGCFYLTFYNPTRTPEKMEADRLPPGEVYAPFHQRMNQWHAEVAAMPHQDMAVTTPDGLTLRGKYYELRPDAPIEILFHGYRGFSGRDMCGAVQRCFSVGHNALLVDQRGWPAREPGCLPVDWGGGGAVRSGSSGDAVRHFYGCHHRIVGGRR